MAERVFSISPKHTNDELSERNSSGSEFREQIAKDIILNAQELVPEGINWKEVVGRFSCRQANGFGKLYGEHAIAYAVAPTVAALVKGAGWDMHSPETVYINGAFFGRVLREDAIGLNKRVRQYEEGEITLDSTDKRDEAFRNAVVLRDRIVTYQGYLREALIDFAQQTLPEDQKYLEMLGTNLAQVVKGPKIYQLYAFLRNRDVDGAYKIYEPRRPNRNPLAYTYIP